jgi:peptide/nickel transport system permease protein
MQACIITISAVYVLANLLADLLYAYFDPRIRYGTAGG